MPLWTPSDDRIRETRLAAFAAANGLPVDYDAIWEWSVTETAAFWQAVWTFGGVVGQAGETAFASAAHIKDAAFFPGARLNYAENLLKSPTNGPAIIFHGEAGVRTEWNWDQLIATVSRLQQALKAEGVGKGDRVAAYMPNLPETIAAMLATASLGAIWSSCSPDFGINGVLDRFGQIEPKVLFTADGYVYNGKQFPSEATALDLKDKIPSIQRVVTVPYIGETSSFEDFMAPFQPEEIVYERTEFAHPLFIMFSSGTTGLPKCITHSAGGALLQHLKEHQLQADVRPGDRLMYFTTCGWMMWNWQVSGLASGATLVLFDGSPFKPDGMRLAQIAAAEKVTHFGTSAKYIDACAKAGVRPRDALDLSALRTVLSTGSPLSAESFDYIYAEWKDDLCLSSIAGGTDILGCFVGGNPIGPVHRGSCQKRHLGMNVRVVDEEGRSLQGEAGELVCISPHPSQPVGFWNDPDGSRYHAAYFDRFENIWCHGDWVVLTEDGGMVFLGRSDAVLNPGGVRIGTAEIYRQVERISEVLEALVIGQDWDNDVRVVLFVRLREGSNLDEALIKTIKSEIRTHASPRHVPAKIIPVADIPRTKSGKIVELAVRNVVHGRPVKNTEALANPEALDLFRGLDALAK
jgi:acetoacetyl-CoA synthetase